MGCGCKKKCSCVVNNTKIQKTTLNSPIQITSVDYIYSVDAGPSITLKTGTSVLVTLTSSIFLTNVTLTSSDTNIAAMSYEIRNAQNVMYDNTPPNINNYGWGPSDFLSLGLSSSDITLTSTGNSGFKASVTYLVTNLTRGTNTFTAMYRSDPRTGNFNSRTIMITNLD